MDEEPKAVEKVWPLYLGDGVYFTPDDFHCIVHTGEAVTTQNVIFLNRDVAEALISMLEIWLEGK